MTRVRWLALVALAGAVAGLARAVVGAQVDWGLPGTPAYQTYELLSRATGVSFLMLLSAPIALLRLDVRHGSRLGRVGAFGLLAGLAAMVVGSVAEFWLLSEVPYGGPASLGRNLSFFVGFFLGSVLALLSMTFVGVWGLRSERLPTWAAVPLIAMPAVFFVLAATLGLPFATVPAGVGIVALGVLTRARREPLTAAAWR